ncbi:MAG: hypothetical protein HYX79_10295 [Chloroflexi bacterium]|nr:hypothetical protein [Chloroflexota bacterium]
MSTICPNCGRKTEGSSCQWCRFPMRRSKPDEGKLATVRCPNCGRKTHQGADCQWCHFPLLKVDPARKNISKRKPEKPGRKTFGLFLLIIIAVILGGSILVLGG